MSNTFIEERADIYKLPQVKRFKSCKDSQITIGDLHGNAVKLLYVIARHGITTKIDDNEYAELVNIYKTIPQELTRNDIGKFKRIINKLDFNRGSKIRLIGDELADRGQNDYFTLIILKKLDENGIKTEILLSNHSVEFFKNYEKNHSFGRSRLLYNQDFSMVAMQNLLDRNIISKDDIKSIIENNYKKSLKVISYTLNTDKNNISIYTHAPIGLNNIKNIADTIKVEYDDASAVKLAITIEKINNIFQSYVSANEINKLCDLNTPNNPFTFLIWNRNYDIIERPVKNNDYTLNFIHGHDDREKTKNNIINLDGNLGKYIDWNKGTYKFVYTTDVTTC